MAFDLKRVLKVLLFASDGALSVKDIQTAIARFHEQATSLPLVEPDGAAAEAGAAEEAPAASATEPQEATAVEPELPAGPQPGDDEIYRDVPSLVTTAQIREAMELIAQEMRAADDGLLA